MPVSARAIEDSRVVRTRGAERLPTVVGAERVLVLLHARGERGAGLLLAEVHHVVALGHRVVDEALGDHGLVHDLVEVWAERRCRLVLPDLLLLGRAMRLHAHLLAGGTLLDVPLAGAVAVALALRRVAGRGDDARAVAHVEAHATLRQEAGLRALVLRVHVRLVAEAVGSKPGVDDEAATASPRRRRRRRVR